MVAKLKSFIYDDDEVTLHHHICESLFPILFFYDFSPVSRKIPNKKLMIKLIMPKNPAYPSSG